MIKNIGQDALAETQSALEKRLTSPGVNGDAVIPQQVTEIFGANLAKDRPTQRAVYHTIKEYCAGRLHKAAITSVIEQIRKYSLRFNSSTEGLVLQNNIAVNALGPDLVKDETFLSQYGAFLSAIVGDEEGEQR